MRMLCHFPRPCRFLFGSVLLAFVLPALLLARAQQLPVGPSSNATTQSSQQIAEMQKVADRWDEAVNQRDQYGLELVLGPQFIAIDDNGEVNNRDEVVSALLRKDAPRYTLDQKVLSVRMVGDVAIVTGSYERTYPGSRLSRRKTKNENGVFSQVYTRRGKRWECIHSQRTLIDAAIAASEEKKSKKQPKEKPLGTKLGFHLPGVH